MFPNGEIATVERVTEDFPAWRMFTFIVETDLNHEVMFAMQNLSAMRSMHNIDPELSEDEAIQAIENILNTEQIVEENNNVSAEERIAAALEYQNAIAE